jgi:hypothetical protein
MTDISVKNRNNAARTYDPTLTSFNRLDFEDTTIAGLTTFSSEAVCKNLNASASVIKIVDNSTGAPAGNVGTLTVPASTTAYTRISGTFTPAAGQGYYRVQFPAAVTTGNLTCHSVRLVVKQTYAWKTAIYYPATAGNYTNNTTFDTTGTSSGNTYGVGSTGTSSMYLYASPGAAFLKSNSKSALIYKQTAALSSVPLCGIRSPIGAV